MTEFNANCYKKTGWRGVHSKCKTCKSITQNARLNRNPYKERFDKKRRHAKHSGVEFTLNFSDVFWPSHCPVLGVELDYAYGTGLTPNSPSFDRIDPTKGYVPGNVIIVSNKANVIKSNANVDELERVSSFYRQLIPHLGASNV